MSEVPGLGICDYGQATAGGGGAWWRKPEFSQVPDLWEPIMKRLHPVAGRSVTRDKMKTLLPWQPSQAKWGQDMHPQFI